MAPPEGEQDDLLERWRAILAEEPPPFKGKPLPDVLAACKQFAERKKQFLRESEPYAKRLDK